MVVEGEGTVVGDAVKIACRVGRMAKAPRTRLFAVAMTGDDC